MVEAVRRGFAAKVAEADGLTIVHRFIGGCKGKAFNESVKRTTDDKPT